MYLLTRKNNDYVLKVLRIQIRIRKFVKDSLNITREGTNLAHISEK